MLAPCWRLLKLTVSIGAISCGAWIFIVWSSAGGLWAGAPLIAFSVMIFLAAVPWLSLDKHDVTRSLGLAGIFLGIISGIVAARYVADPYISKDCMDLSGRAWRACHVFNWIYELGGNNAIVGTFIVISAVLVSCCLWLIFRPRVNLPGLPDHNNVA